MNVNGAFGMPIENMGRFTFDIPVKRWENVCEMRNYCLRNRLDAWSQEVVGLFHSRKWHIVVHCSTMEREAQRHFKNLVILSKRKHRLPSVYGR